MSMAAPAPYLGPTYIPTRQEIRQHLEQSREIAEIVFAYEEPHTPEDLTRYIWRQAVRLARFQYRPRGRFITPNENGGCTR